ncbi:hypothetical protein CEP50_10270 [Actinopolyspora mortivallis]|uniref:DUF3558 domain-containing protein n=1 Tax=Actinopolyspora mortivallis TaxID=33906 RepID=A0A2T0GWH1_ACTMO|nr:hypothetical protein CEP50_10270 [Actinopolyspora mortivallis]
MRVVAGLLAVAFLGGGCGDSDRPGPDPTRSTETAEDSAGGAEGTNEQTQPVVLGDLDPPRDARELGAPFDPCDSGLWQAVPERVRPPEPGEDEPVVLSPQDNEGTPQGLTCKFANHQTSAEGTDGVLRVYVSWGRTLRPLESPERTTFGSGTPGAIKRSRAVFRRDSEGNPTATAPKCAAEAELSEGEAAVSVLNPAFPDVAPCDVARAVMDRVVESSS